MSADTFCHHGSFMQVSVKKSLIVLVKLIVNTFSALLGKIN